MIFAGIGKAALGFLIKNWRAFIVAAVLGSCLWIFLDWRAQAEEIAALEYTLKLQRGMTEIWRDTARHQSEKAKEAAELRDEFERLLAEKLAEPPAAVFKPAEPEIHEIIIESQECGEAVEKIGAHLKGLLEGRQQ